MLKKTPTKNAKKFICVDCDYKCSKNSEWMRHLITRKHISLTDLTEKTPQHNCENCKKKYKTREGLWYHNKKCIIGEKLEQSNKIDNSDKIDDVKSLSNMVIELVKTNNELQKTLAEVCRKIQPTVINTTNSNNKTFNLQFFLNEQCKDAMNIMDFVNSVTLQLSDLESVEKLGYVEGISNIMIQKLNEMDIYKRPMHCSDLKRETMYVKDKDKWEKDDNDHAILRKAIKYISKKNSDLLAKWSNKHPASKNIESHVNEQYMRLIKQAMGGCGEIIDNEDKIIKRIAKMMTIEKE